VGLVGDDTWGLDGTLLFRGGADPRAGGRPHVRHVRGHVGVLQQCIQTPPRVVEDVFGQGKLSQRSNNLKKRRCRKAPLTVECRYFQSRLACGW
jgi:hypothetical protein